MKTDFICPRCKGFLNVGSHIILAADTEHGDSGLVLLHPDLGNYATATHPEFKTLKGEKYEFFCPICQEKLSSDVHDNLSHILMVDEKGQKYQILFSKIAGEESTYKIVGETVDYYGEHYSNYVDFINLSRTK